MDRLHNSGARSETLLVLTMTALVTVFPLVPRTIIALPAIAILVLTVLAWRFRAIAATSLGVFVVSCVFLRLAGLSPQQVLFPAAFALYALVLRRIGWLTPAFAWLRAGKLSGSTIGLCVGIAAATAVVLLVWYTVVRPDVADLVQTYVPDQPAWLLIPGAILFSFLNAAIEEAVYRGVLLHALEAAIGPGIVAVLLQAIAFGTLHIHGFPRGLTGVGLAILYGLALGVLRRKSGGLLAPWLAHVLTDLTIAAFLITLADGSLR